MQQSGVPTKFPIPFASGAGAGYARQIPEASQIGTNPGFASLTDGFPPLCFTPVSSGGTPPFGQDVNGLLLQITEWAQWLSAGAPIQFDAAFSTAIGGYPKGAVVASATVFGLYWLSLADNNTTNPDTGGAGWKGFSLTGGSVNYYVDTGAANAMAITAIPAVAAYADGLTFWVDPSSANAGATTLSVNGLAAVPVKNPDGSAVAAGKIQPGAIMLLTYQGGAFQWLNSPFNASPASAALIWAGTDNASFVTAKGLKDAMAFQTLTDAATVAWDMNGGFNANLTLTAAIGATRVIGLPTNLQPGAPIWLDIDQGTGGNMWASFAPGWDFGAIGPPGSTGFSTVAGKSDAVSGIVKRDGSGIKATFWKAG